MPVIAECRVHEMVAHWCSCALQDYKEYPILGTFNNAVRRTSVDYVSDFYPCCKVELMRRRQRCVGWVLESALFDLNPLSLRYRNTPTRTRICTIDYMNTGKNQIRSVCHNGVQDDVD